MMGVTELSNELAKDLQIAKGSSRIIVNTFIDVLKRGILEGQEINLVGVCKMGLVHSKNKKFTTNIPKGTVVVKPSYSRLYCKFSRVLKNSVQAKSEKMDYDELMRAQAVKSGKGRGKEEDVEVMESEEDFPAYEEE